MSITYPDLENKFPDSIDNYDRFLDPTLEMLSVINQYYTKFDSGDLEGANALLTSNPILKQMVINANNLNQLRDMCISLERYYMNDVQQYIMDIIKEPVNYNASTKYVRYDVVGYIVNGVRQYFWCFNDNTPIGTLPTNTTYFIPLTLRGDSIEYDWDGTKLGVRVEGEVNYTYTDLKGLDGVGLLYKGQWNADTQYLVNQCVSHDNILWACNVDNVNSEPYVGNPNWSPALDIPKQINISPTQPIGQSIGDIWYAVI